MRVALGREYRGHRVQQGPVVHRAFEGQSGLEAGGVQASALGWPHRPHSVLLDVSLPWIL